MSKKIYNPFLIVILNIIHFTVASLLPIYNKELFKNIPFPIYSTFIQVFFSILPSFILTWIIKGFPLSINWIFPKKIIFPKIFICSFLYGLMMLFGNLGFYVSSIDFAVLFRLSTIISSGLCGFLFLNEKVSKIGSISIILVLIGLIILTSDFQWSTNKMPSSKQLIIQIFAVITSSLASLWLKFSIFILDETIEGYEPFTLLFWRFLFGSIPIFFSSIFIEPGIYLNFKIINNKNFFLWTLLGLFLSGIYQILTIVLHQATNLVTLTIISQMKFLPTLIISKYLYNETKWNFKQIFGVLFLIIGSITYSLTRINCNKEIKKSNSYEDIFKIEFEEEEEDKKN